VARYFSFRGFLLFGTAVVAIAIDGGLSFAESFQGNDQHSNNGWGVYQRHAFDRDKKDDQRDRRNFRRNFPMIVAPQVSSAWFQRPYPYHLDYYRMRYGGSYAPYFGNLYGPSGYPAYYGPYYGGYGDAYGNGFGNGYGQVPYGGVPPAFPDDEAVTAPGVGAGKAESNKPQAPPSATSNDVLPYPAVKQ